MLAVRQTAFGTSRRFSLVRNFRMSFCIDIRIGIGITAGLTGVRGKAAFRTGWCCYHGRIIMTFRRDFSRFKVGAIGTGSALFTLFGAGWCFRLCPCAQAVSFGRDDFLFLCNCSTDGAMLAVRQTAFGTSRRFALVRNFHMSFCIDIRIGIEISAGLTGVRGKALFGTSRRSNHAYILVLMLQHGNFFSFGFSAGCTGIGANPRRYFGRFFCNNAFSPSVIFRGNNVLAYQNFIANRANGSIRQTAFGAGCRLTRNND